MIRLLVVTLIILSAISCKADSIELNKNGIGELALGINKEKVLNELVLKVEKKIVYGEENFVEYHVAYKENNLVLRFDSNELYYVELKDLSLKTHIDIGIGDSLATLRDKCSNLSISSGHAEGGYFTGNCLDVMYFFSLDNLTSKELVSGEVGGNKENEVRISRIYIISI
ncbi:MAG: hypothetical protein COA86_01900 [Kangiella sp.]|nr:MAG: hypothetical protein COA86_01900 [Kangiella sp.]